jgi:hypothetical protein
MGVARLLAKGWVVFCIFAGAHAVARGVQPGTPVLSVLEPTAVAMFLFGAMGVLFIAGYGLSSGHLLQRFKPMHILPGFNEIVFLGFLVLSFAIQIAPHHLSWGILNMLEAAVRFAVPGQRALEAALSRCSLDGGRAFAAACTWLFAFVFLGSALSHVRMAAGLVRLERKRRIEPLGAAGIALVLGAVTIAGIQFLFVGTLFPTLPCPMLSGLLGAVLMGAAPLMLAYLAAAAIINLIAINPDS